MSDSLPVLLKDARWAMGAERRLRADRFNRECAALPPSRENADALLALVESDAMDGLVAQDGVSCRDAAFRALLGMGYPYALEISPEALASLRRKSRAGPVSFWQRRRWLYAGVALACVGLWALLATLRFH